MNLRWLLCTGGGIRLAALAVVAFRPRTQPDLPALPIRESSPAPGAVALPLAESARPSPAETRAAAMRATRAAIHVQCQNVAGGDWGQWLRQLSAFRAELGKRIQAAKPHNPTATGSFEARSGVLEGKEGFALFESAPTHYLKYLVDPSSLDAFRKERPVVAGARWLKRQGIEVLFILVPKMTEVYAEYFVEHCPEDRTVAPQLRQVFLELLEADVEVIDLLPTFLQERDRVPEPLYMSADPHWSSRAREVTARVIADRLKRYDFVRTARAAEATFRAVQVPYPFPISNGAAYEALTPDQRLRAERVWPRCQEWAATPAGRPFLAEESPVVLIGDSYNYFLGELIGREINLPVQVLIGGGQTTHAFKEFLRDPDLLRSCKVVLWLVCSSSLQNPWPLPQVIRAAAGEPADR